MKKSMTIIRAPVIFLTSGDGQKAMPAQIPFGYTPLVGI